MKLEDFFSFDKIKLGWERYLRVTQWEIKDHIGINAFIWDLEKNLNNLSNKLVNNEYIPKNAFVFNVPKPNKLQRTLSILQIEDAIVYQTLANNFAFDLFEDFKKLNHVSFGFTLNDEVEKDIDLLNYDDSNYYFFQRYQKTYKLFQEKIKSNNRKFKLQTDFTAFYDLISHDLLIRSLKKKCFENEDIYSFFKKCLKKWTNHNVNLIKNCGIPQTEVASPFFANFILQELDLFMEDNGNFYLRYMDDIWIFDDDEEKLWSILLDIDNFARERGLCLNPLKTSISSFDESDFIDFEPSGRTIIELDDVDFTNEMDAIIDLDNIYSHESNEPKLNMSIDEFMNNCGYQVIENYNNILEIDQNNNELNKNLQNLVVKYCYKMNKAFEAIEYYDYRLLNYDSIDNYIFINLLNSYFWKCEPICKVLSFYEKSINLKNQLFELFHQYDSYEWFVFHIAKCLYRKQKLDLFDVRMIQIYIDSSNSWLAKSALYPLILKNTQEDEDVSSAIKRDLFEKEDYKVIRSVVFNEYKDLCSVKLFTNEEIKNILKKDQNV